QQQQQHQQQQQLQLQQQQQQQKQQQQNALMQHQQQRAILERMQNEAAANAAAAAAASANGVSANGVVDNFNTTHIFVNQNGHVIKIPNPFFNNNAASASGKDGPNQLQQMHAFQQQFHHQQALQQAMQQHQAQQQAQHQAQQQAQQQRMHMGMQQPQSSTHAVRPAAVLQPIPQPPTSVPIGHNNITPSQYHAILAQKGMQQMQQLQPRPPTSSAGDTQQHPTLVPLLAASQAPLVVPSPTPVMSTAPAAAIAAALPNMTQQQILQLQNQISMAQMQQQLVAAAAVGGAPQGQQALMQGAMQGQGMVRPQPMDFNQFRLFNNQSS
ncbi:hypothetical protein PMAYCL1PPCAC_29746, partial [Pristionchus mayeri]